MATKRTTKTRAKRRRNATAVRESLTTTSKRRRKKVGKRKPAPSEEKDVHVTGYNRKKHPIREHDVKTHDVKDYWRRKPRRRRKK